MNYDLYVEYPCSNEREIRQIVGNHPKSHAELESPYTRVAVLAPALVERTREFAKSGHPRHGGGYQSLVFSPRGPNVYNRQEIAPNLESMAELGLYPPQPSIQELPYLTSFVQIHFTLATPAMLKGMEKFYIHENPLLRETAFKVPLVPPSSWKGIFRKVGQRLLVSMREYEDSFDRMFGHVTADEETTAQRGCLHFYPTFFDRMGLDVLNPHDRRTKAGTVPITMEIVIPTAQGILTLLYAPSESSYTTEISELRGVVARDLTFLVEVIYYALHTYGVGGKLTDDWGLVRRRYVNPAAKGPGGCVEISGVEIPHEETKPPREAHWKGQLRPRVKGAYFETPDEFRKIVAKIREVLGA